MGYLLYIFISKFTLRGVVYERPRQVGGGDRNRVSWEGESDVGGHAKYAPTQLATGCNIQRVPGRNVLAHRVA